ncbi:MAG: hypothetical protein ABIW76_11880 [Fibrobacteria bacterium]
MDINSLASGTQNPVSQSPQTARRNADAFAIAKIQNHGSLVSGLLPSLNQGVGRGPGLGLDIYTAVGMQTQGMMSRGLMGVQIANISLGIDMSQAGKDLVESGSDASADEGDPGTSGTPAATDSGHTNTVLNEILKADGVETPEANPYAVTRDYFADRKAPEEAASRLYSNPDLSNPALGGLLNSLG